MGHYYRFKRGDPVTITSGRYKGIKGVVDSAVFQRTNDAPDEYAPGYHVILDTGPVVTVRWELEDVYQNPEGQRLLFVRGACQ